jgi:glycogen debranching enzyme
MNTSLIPQTLSLSREWLEADGLGGFAMGTATGLRTRRYHSLLLTATTPPTGRLVLVNGFDAWVETRAGRFELSSQCYAPDVVGGDGLKHIKAFGSDPWPNWIFKLPDGTRIEMELFAVKGQPVTCLSWKVLGPALNVKLFVRPFLSGRDYHSLHKSNPAFRFDADARPDRVSWRPDRVSWRPYADVPGVTAFTNGTYTHEPHWYYNFLYSEEQARGLDCTEDLATPGVLAWDLAKGKAALVLTTHDHAPAFPGVVKPVELLNKLRAAELKRRQQFPSRLHAAADAYLVQRRGAQSSGSASSKSIIAGYPWFADWGRDTLIALRGLCLATGRLDEARDILLTWAGTVSEGMLPNRFPDQGVQPEFNAVDASLWFIIAAQEYLQEVQLGRAVLSAPQSDREHVNGRLRTASPTSVEDVSRLRAAIEAILEGYAVGTRFGIRMDYDGLIACGVPGVQLTWMDAKVGDWVVTPRIGKPVEVQALWLNALHVGSQFNPRWRELLERGTASFRERFWNESARCLYDVIDVDHQRGTVDASFRPNQIFAVGGLPVPLLEGERARLVVEAVEDRLVTPLGLRSLAPGENGYAPHYQGGVRERDGAYHQGTVWPWLIGAFVEAWVRVRGGTNEVKRQARTRFVAPLLRHLEEAGLGHVSEITDAEAPFTPRGCPFQAWSVGELLRLEHTVLAETHSDAAPVAQTSESAVSPVSNRPGAPKSHTLAKSASSQAGSAATQQTRRSALRTRRSKPALQPAA